MKISTKGRYAVRAMVDLAMQDDTSLVLLKDIASRQDLPERYLEHLMLSLKNAGLVRSNRGARGGYSLARDASEISLLEVLRVTVGDLCPVDCVPNPEDCPRSSICAVRDVWAEINKGLSDLLGGLSLRDLIERQKSKESTGPGMYYI